MILVDTSIWIDHLRAGDAGLAGLLNDNNVLAHPWVTGELAVGNLSRRTTPSHTGTVVRGDGWSRSPGVEHRSNGGVS